MKGCDLDIEFPNGSSMLWQLTLDIAVNITKSALDRVVSMNELQQFDSTERLEWRWS